MRGTPSSPKALFSRHDGKSETNRVPSALSIFANPLAALTMIRSSCLCSVSALLPCIAVQTNAQSLDDPSCPSLLGPYSSIGLLRRSAPGKPVFACWVDTMSQFKSLKVPLSGHFRGSLSIDQPKKFLNSSLTSYTTLCLL